jgi:CcmD family protein
MTYLFWSFAVVWVALFAYVRALMRRTHALEGEVRQLAGGVAAASATAHRTEERPAPVRHEAPSPVGRAAP